MAKYFEESGFVKNYLLASCIRPTVLRGKRRGRLRKIDYESNKKNYDSQIKNRFKTLNKHLAKLGYTVRFRSQYSELIPSK